MGMDQDQCPTLNVGVVFRTRKTSEKAVEAADEAAMLLYRYICDEPSLTNSTRLLKDQLVEGRF